MLKKLILLAQPLLMVTHVEVLIVNNDLSRSKPLKQSLIENGFDAIAHVEDDVNLHDVCCEISPDIVIIDTESPNRDTL